MAKQRGLRVKVPIRFSEKAQRDLYETCMAYKDLAEVRGAENAKLRNLVSDMWTCISECEYGDCSYCSRLDSCVGGISEFSDRMTEVGIEVPEWKVPHERDNHLIRENRNLKSCIRGLAESLSTFESEFNKMSARVSELAGDDDVFTLNVIDIWRPILKGYGIELKT